MVLQNVQNNCVKRRKIWAWGAGGRTHVMPPLGCQQVIEQSCDWNHQRPADIIKSQSMDLDMDQSSYKIHKARLTYARERTVPVEPVDHKPPAGLKCYINSKIPSGTHWHHIPVSTSLCSHTQEHGTQVMCVVGLCHYWSLNCSVAGVSKCNKSINKNDDVAKHQE